MIAPQTKGFAAFLKGGGSGIFVWVLVSCLIISPAYARTLEDVRSSGVLSCGVSLDRPGFSVRDKEYRWTGFDVDICRAIAVAALGDARKVNFVALGDDERVVALQSGEIDILARGAAWTLSEEGANGLMFVTPTYVELKDNKTLILQGPVVRQGDDQWFQLVRWVVFALIKAEEVGVTFANVADKATDATPEIKQFQADEQGLGAVPGWKTTLISAVGNYGEIFVRNFPTTKRGPNRLWRDGGVLMAPSFE